MNTIILSLGLFTDKNLTATERIVYAYINETAKVNGYTELTDQGLADDLAMHLTTIKRSLTNLDKKGYIQRQTKNVKFTLTRKIYPLKQY